MKQPSYRHPLRPALTLCLPTWCFAEKITLAWDANMSPRSLAIRLSYGTTPGVHTTTLDVGNQTTTAFTGLAPGQRYYFVVRAYSATQVSPRQSRSPASHWDWSR